MQKELMRKSGRVLCNAVFKTCKKEQINLILIENYYKRDLNDGFSGGKKEKWTCSNF